MPNITPPNNTTTPIIINSSTPSVYTEFMRIHDIPYNEANYNCKNKSEDFADYLISKGAINISTVQIYYKDNTYTHQFILWNGRIYDPTPTQIIYDIEPQRYYDGLYQLGFTGMRITSPYI
jgi:hypothetical protein